MMEIPTVEELEEVGLTQEQAESFLDEAVKCPLWLKKAKWLALAQDWRNQQG